MRLKTGGRATGELCYFPDLMNTFWELAGLPPPQGPSDGHSLVPLLTGNEREQPRHEHLYFEFRNCQLED